MSSPTTTTVKVAGNIININEAGDGDTLIILHRSTGRAGWGAYEDNLAKKFRVLVPDLPGFGYSERPDWAREPRDLAILINDMALNLELTQACLVGLGLGGFIAAELATMNPAWLKRLVLVTPAGIKPREGEILDQMLVSHSEYVKKGFSEESLFTEMYGEEIAREVRDVWDFSRIMTARITWSPYMFSRRLPHLLAEAKVPTLVVWGSETVVIPQICGEQYVEALPNARMETVKTGHLVELEQPELLSELTGQYALANN